MSHAIQRWRGLFWALGIMTMAMLTGLAWHQIDAVLARCSFF